MGFEGIGLLVNLVAVTASFVLIARALGPDHYGLVAGSVALTTIVGPFSSGGANHLLVKRRAQTDESLSVIIRPLLGMVLTGGAGAMLVVLAVRPFVLEVIPAEVLALICVSELVLGRSLVLLQQVGQALERLEISSFIRSQWSVARLTGTLIYLLVVPRATPAGWALALLCINAAGVTLAWLTVRRTTSTTVTVSLPGFGDVGEGLAFSMNASSEFIKKDIDKTLLISIKGEGVAGLYTAAYRVLEIAMAPIIALANSTSSRFFRQGATSVEQTRILARRLTSILAVYGMTCLVALWLGAPLLSWILGDQYDEAVSVLRWIVAIPLLVGMQVFAAALLTGIGRQHERLLYSAIGTVTNVVLNLALIPTWSWRGAVVATYIAELVSLVGLWSAYFRLADKGTVEEQA